MAAPNTPFTKPVLELFESMLDGVSISANDPHFEETARRITAAKKQLAKALDKDKPTPRNRAERRAKR